MATGKELWKKQRDEYPGWCTPNIYFDEDKTLVAVNGFKHRGGYDFKTGQSSFCIPVISLIFVA